VFYERDVPYYAAQRDLFAPHDVRLVLYQNWHEVKTAAHRDAADADVAMVTSYCPDAIEATALVTERARLSCFYDMDTPTTLTELESDSRVAYIGPRGLRDFDLVLSYTGGRALTELQRRLGAARVAPLYGSVDPETHYPVAPVPRYAASLSYLGTYAADRQPALDALFLEAARARPHRRFIIGGAQYPETFPWTPNIFFVRHLPPAEHPAFFCSSPLTLNVTRRAFAEMGYCPSGRLFEAAACGAIILSDAWEGLNEFFTPDEEILITRGVADTIAALDRDPAELRQIAQRARARALNDHTADRRARDLERAVEAAYAAAPAATVDLDRVDLAALVASDERPRAVSEYLVERMLRAGADHLCFVVSPGKSDILEYYGGEIGGAHICYTVQHDPAGLCDALFRALPLLPPDDEVLIGLPDTIWYPVNALALVPSDTLSFVLFPVERAELFVGTLVNEYLARGGDAVGARIGRSYVDVGTLNGYREAIALLSTGHIEERETPIVPQTELARSAAAGDCSARTHRDNVCDLPRTP
jgi:spore maturation protein CgeB